MNGLLRRKMSSIRTRQYNEQDKTMENALNMKNMVMFKLNVQISIEKPPKDFTRTIYLEVEVMKIVQNIKKSLISTS